MDVYVYGIYFALILYVNVKYFEQVASAQIFQHSLVGSGQRFAGRAQKSDPWTTLGHII